MFQKLIRLKIKGMHPRMFLKSYFITKQNKVEQSNTVVLIAF